MGHHELWLTKLFNDTLAAPARQVLEMVNGWNLPGVRFEHLDRPWENYITFQILVALLLVIVALVVRASLSVEKPGALQNVFEGIYTFIRTQAAELIHHGSEKYLGYFLTIFVFILASNLIGIVPTMHSPTMDPYVPLGCAVLTFVFYNYLGFKENGFGYVKHFMGPVIFLAPLMFVIEILSHLARPMSLTVRLYANMYVGEMITDAFLGLAPLLVPVIFMGLHTFVSLLQSFIFTLLSMVYVGMSTEHEH
jgi:F-type H+-transporting ATPase subunit a